MCVCVKCDSVCRCTCVYVCMCRFILKKDGMDLKLLCSTHMKIVWCNLKKLADGDLCMWCVCKREREGGGGGEISVCLTLVV